MAGEVEQPRDGVAIGAIASGGDRDRAGGIRRNHLHLHALPLLCTARPVRVPGGQDLAERRREPVVAQEEIDEARPRDLGAVDRLEPRCRLGDLGRDLPRGLPSRPGELQRDVRRVVAVLGPRRALELELGPRHIGDRGRERPDGISRQRSRRQRRGPRAPEISSGEPTPIRTSPTSIGVSGSGVVSKLPSDFRNAITIAPVSWRMRSSRIVRPAAAHVRRISISASWRSGPAAVVTASRKAVTCGLSTRFAMTWPAVLYGSTTRFAPARISFCSESARDARATIVRSGRAERAERTTKRLSTSESEAATSPRARSRPAP